MATIKVQLNGKPRDVPAGLSVTGLLEFLQVPIGRVAVEQNTEVVPKAHHASTLVNAGDVIEVVTFVGGG